MMDRGKGWTPPVIAAAAFLLGVYHTVELTVLPPGMGEFVFLGNVLDGKLAWSAAAAHVVFLFLVAYGAWHRMATVVRLVFAYCFYWIASVWVFSWRYLPQSTQTRLLTAGLVSVLLLVVARRVQLKRHQFDA